MSRHDGVSCDACLLANFRGRRYKCLICYDYDLCATCYEAGATNTRHTTDHPMQCIITRADYDLFYGGEALNSLEMQLPQSFTCPYCSKMGFTDVTLQEHVTADHTDTSFEVVCPLCAAMPGGDPNLMTDDFAGHLTLEHRTGPRDLISFLDEPAGSRHGVRRIPPNASYVGRGAASLRPRRSNMHFSIFSSSGLSSLSPSSRESVDPIAELLSQLSGVRRSASNTTSSTPTQLQQLQMQLQLERQQISAARQQLERFPRRQNQSQAAAVRESHAAAVAGGASSLLLNSGGATLAPQPAANAPAPPPPQSQYMLVGLLEELAQQTVTDVSRQDRSQFVQELVLSSITQRRRAPEANDAQIVEIEDGDEAGEGEEEGAVGGEVGRALGRTGNVVLRGRARSDSQNSRRRAEANRVEADSNPNGGGNASDR